jgi:hypothetical protein
MDVEPTEETPLLLDGQLSPDPSEMTAASW